MKSFLLFLQEENEKSPLDTTVWSTENNTGSLRELLNSTEEHSSVVPLEIQKLLPKTTKWQGDEKEWERVKKVNLSHPITVITGKNGEIHSIPDGHHRIHAANAQGMTHINARVISFDSLPEKFQEIFGQERP